MPAVGRNTFNAPPRLAARGVEDSYSDVIDIRRLSLDGNAPREPLALEDDDDDDDLSVLSATSESLFDREEIREDGRSKCSSTSSIQSLGLRVERHAELRAPSDDNLVIMRPVRLRQTRVNVCDQTWRHAWHGGPAGGVMTGTPRNMKRYGMQINNDSF